MEEVIQICKDHANVTLGVALAAMYVSYYLLLAVRTPKIHASKKLKTFLLAHCPVLSENYWPTFWMINAYLQALYEGLVILPLNKRDVQYDREIVVAADGGQFALDWVVPLCKLNKPSADAPTVIFTPGYGGSASESVYMVECLKDTSKMGYRVVVLNYRGFQTKLLTPKFTNPEKADDMKLAIAQIQARFPSSPIAAVGFSYGGLLTGNYLHNCGNKSGLIAGMAISAPWDYSAVHETLAQYCNFPIRYFHMKNVKQAVKDNPLVFRDQPLFQDDFYDASLEEMDKRMVCGLLGYSSLQEFLAKVSLDNKKVQSISTPFLCLNAVDDMVASWHGVPTKAAQNSSHVAIIETARGGHCAFMEGILPRKRFHSRVVAQCLKAVFENANTLRDAADDS